MSIASAGPTVLAFSGGLDTSFCVPYLRETTGAEVHTVTVNTGGFTAADLAAVEARACELGAASHTTVDARAALFERVLQFLVKGNVLRGGVYPLCVGPERVVQAQALVAEAARLGATRLAHGSTGAGNDQVRFDTALRLLAESEIGDVEILAPIRALNLSREASTAYLAERGVDVPAKTTDYSVNRGLWGTRWRPASAAAPRRPAQCTIVFSATWQVPRDAYPCPIRLGPAWFVAYD